MDKTLHKNKQNENFEKICETINLQIDAEDTNFILNMRKICELLLSDIYDENTNYEFLSENRMDRHRKMREAIKKDENGNLKLIYEECFEKLSDFIHYQFDKTVEYVEMDEIEKIVDIINGISKERGFAKEIIFPEQMKNKNIALSHRNVSIKKTSIWEMLSLEYVLPMYQRQFKWSEKEIISLFNEICEQNFDLGIIYKSTDDEIIDGQQRIHAMLIIAKMINNIKNEDVIDVKNIFLKRERPVNNWRGDFNLLNEEIDKAIINGDGELYNVYLKIKKKINLGEINIDELISYFKKMYFFVRKINTNKGTYYFNKINQTGIPLSEYENILSLFVHKNKGKDSFLKKITDIWDKIDLLSEDSKQLKFVNDLLILHREEIMIMKEDEVISFFNNIYLIVKGDTQNFLTIWEEKTIQGKNHEYTQNELSLVFLEIKLKTNDNEFINKIIFIKNAFKNLDKTFSGESAGFIKNVVVFIFENLILEKEIYHFLKNNLTKIIPNLNVIVSVKENDYEIFSLIKESDSKFFREENGILIGYNSSINTSRQGFDLTPIEWNSKIIKLIKSVVNDEISKQSTPENIGKEIIEVLCERIKENSFYDEVKEFIFNGRFPTQLSTLINVNKASVSSSVKVINNSIISGLLMMIINKEEHLSQRPQFNKRQITYKNIWMEIKSYPKFNDDFNEIMNKYLNDNNFLVINPDDFINKI